MDTDLIKQLNDMIVIKDDRIIAYKSIIKIQEGIIMHNENRMKQYVILSFSFGVIVTILLMSILFILI